MAFMILRLGVVGIDTDTERQRNDREEQGDIDGEWDLSQSTNGFIRLSNASSVHT